MEPALSIQNIRKQYKGILAVDNVSLDIYPQEIYGFVGPNGAGKSTTIKAMLNYIHLDSGRATILGLDCVNDAKRIKQSVGYVPSEVNFYPNLTCYETIRYAMRFHHNDNLSDAKALMETFQVDPHKKMHALSLGNKKKIAIICAIVNKPQVLILDEPTNGLDPLIQTILFETLKTLRKNGTTIFISSHNLKEIQDHCDRVAFIKSGKILKVFEMDNVKLDGKYVKIHADSDTIEILSHKVHDIKKITDTSLGFIYRGGTNSLLSLLSAYDLHDITISTLSLEHEFMEYYKEESQ